MSDKPNRRWYQFSLKTLLVVLTLLCIGPGGYVAYEQSKARRQKAAVDAIEKLGGSVEYDETVPVCSATVRQIVGDETFGSVCLVDFRDAPVVTNGGLVQLADLKVLRTLYLDNTKVTDVGLVHLVGLKGLKSLSLTNTQLTDDCFVHLTGLKGLKYLWLDGTHVTDAGLVHLAGLTNLDCLHLDDTQVTDTGVAELKKSLPHCTIWRLK